MGALCFYYSRYRQTSDNEELISLTISSPLKEKSTQTGTPSITRKADDQTPGSAPAATVINVEETNLGSNSCSDWPEESEYLLLKQTTTTTTTIEPEFTEETEPENSEDENDENASLLQDLHTNLTKQKEEYASQMGDKAEHLTTYLESLIPLTSKIQHIENNPDLTADEIMAFVEEATKIITTLETDYLNKESEEASQLPADSKVKESIKTLMTKIETLVSRAELIRQKEEPEAEPLKLPDELITFGTKLGWVKRLINLFEKQEELRIPALPTQMRKSILTGSTTSLWNTLNYNVETDSAQT